MGGRRAETGDCCAAEDGRGCCPSPEKQQQQPAGRVLVQHLAACAASNTAFVAGLALGWSSATLAMRTESVQGFPITIEEWSWVTSLYGVGGGIGAASVGRLVHVLGRRVVLLAFGPVSLAAWALILWSSSVWMLFAGRVMIGASCGAACVATPIYVCEMAHPSIRGALSTYFEILICVGIFFAYVLGKLLPVFWVNVVCLSFSVVHVLCFAWFPDTPRWYLLRGREEDARRSMLFFRGTDYDVDGEMQLIKEGVKESEGAAEGGWRVFAAPAARKALTITIILMVLQQITGVNAITFYATQLFRDAGAFDAYTASIVVAAVEVLAAVVSMFCVDRLGRRVLLLISGICMAVTTGLMGCYFFFKDYLGDDLSSISWLPIVVVSVYMFMFSVGFGPVIWVFLGEIFPDNVKGVATGVASGLGWFFSFLVTKFYPGLADSLGNYTCYWGFCAICVLSCIYIFFGMPETKGKTLDEIQAEL